MLNHYELTGAIMSISILEHYFDKYEITPINIDQNMILLEQLLPSEFKWGFELEAIAPTEYLDRNGMDDESYYPRYKETELNDYLTNAFGITGDLKDDSSIEAYGENEPTFEFASDVLKFTPNNLMKFRDGLGKLSRDGFYTNITCGMHVHLSWPGINTLDAAWVIICLANDMKARESIKQLGNTSFFKQSETDMKYLDRIKHGIDTDDISSIVYELTNEKTRMLHLHSQGTIEWRGPRGFLNDSKRVQISDFLVLLYSFIKWIINCLSLKQVGNVSRDMIMRDPSIRSLLRIPGDLKSLASRNLPHTDEIKAVIEEPRLINHFKFTDDELLSIFKEAPVALVVMHNIPRHLVSDIININPKTLYYLSSRYVPFPLFMKAIYKYKSNLEPLQWPFIKKYIKNNDELHEFIVANGDHIAGNTIPYGALSLSDTLFLVLKNPKIARTMSSGPHMKNVYDLYSRLTNNVLDAKTQEYINKAKSEMIAVNAKYGLK